MPTLPSDCPIPNASTKILERRQTEDGFGRNFYLVEITQDRTEVQTVDVSRILQYVSPSELERFENEQFRVEAEAQAIADREGEEEQVRRRMAKNARAAGSGRGGGGRGRGSRTLNGLGVGSELPTRMRGGRARGRIGRRGRGGLALSRELPEETAVNGEARPQDTTVTSSGEEDEQPQLASPNLMRSAFVANSALPPPALQRGHPEVPEIDTASPSDSSTSIDSDEHRSKRRRTESVTPQRTIQSSLSQNESESEDSIPPDPPSTVKANRFQHDETTPRASHSMLQPAADLDEPHDESEDEDVEEYVVEAIIEHFHNEDGRKFYLVK